MARERAFSGALDVSPADAFARRGFLGSLLLHLPKPVALEDERLDFAPGLHLRRIQDHSALIPGVRLEARVTLHERCGVVRLEPEGDLADAMFLSAGREELVAHVEGRLPEVIAFTGI